MLEESAVLSHGRSHRFDPCHAHLTAIGGMKAILPLKRLDLVTFFNRTRPQHICVGPCRIGDVLRSSRHLASQRWAAFGLPARVPPCPKRRSATVASGQQRSLSEAPDLCHSRTASSPTVLPKLAVFRLVRAGSVADG